jgi:hypothetical protein
MTPSGIAGLCATGLTEPEGCQAKTELLRGPFLWSATLDGHRTGRREGAANPFPVSFYTKTTRSLCLDDPLGPGALFALKCES